MKYALPAAIEAYYRKPLTVFREADLDQNEIKANTAFFADEHFIIPEHRQLPLKKEKRFPWGTVQLEYQLDNEVITGINIYSDALETEYLSRLPKMLINQKIHTLCLPETDPEINSDICELLNEEV